MSVASDRTALRASSSNSLATALDTISEPVLILDRDWTIEFVNPAMAYCLGRSAGELRGAYVGDVMIVPADWEAGDFDWPASAPRNSRTGVVTLRAAGVRSTQEALMTQVRSGTGSVTGYVVVLPTSGEDDTMSSRAHWEADRAAILRIMADVRPEAGITETATQLCHAVEGMQDIDGAMVIIAPDVGDFVVVSNGETSPEFLAGSYVPVDQAERLLAATEAGPWMLDLAHDSARELIGSGLVDSIRSLGFTASGYVGIRAEGQLTGVLAVASGASDGPRRIAGMLSILEHVGALAGVVLGRQVIRHQHLQTQRNIVRAVIDDRLFHPVFQPIVRLADKAVIGYEALTRFDSGRVPNEMIDLAHSVGLGAELEEACVLSALGQATALPQGPFLSINYSPDCVLSGSVRRTATGTDRPLVVEITENARVTDYAALRESLGQAKGVKLAVDDAGAGFSSLGHILELRPSFVKLDRGLIHDIDNDPARSAMVAGVSHFANQTDTCLIAEGVETEAEAHALQSLGVKFAQGYLFGRPRPLV